MDKVVESRAMLAIERLAQECLESLCDFVVDDHIA
jgi:hypothetical protein